MVNEFIYAELERNAEVIRQLLSGLDEATFRWRSAEGKWNLLDVICHFYDEEIEDFRARVKLLLEDPTQRWVKILPAQWPEERNYQNENFEQRINDFAAEREKSVEWLRSLENPKWDNGFEHPKAGFVSAQLVLDNWLAHDLLHIRQIIRIKYEYLKAYANNPLDYAGDW